LIDADVELFTAPKSKSKALHPRQSHKPLNKAVTNVQAIPDTLIAARNIGSLGAASPTPSRISHLPAKPTFVPVSPELVPARKPSSSLPHASLPAAPVAHGIGSGRAPMPGESSAGGGPRPTQNPPRFTRPVKRPKQSSSMFIPKKRPAHGDEGPPSKKRA